MKVADTGIQKKGWCYSSASMMSSQCLTLGSSFFIIIKMLYF